MIKVNGSDTHLSDATALGYAYAIIIFFCMVWYGRRFMMRVIHLGDSKPSDATGCTPTGNIL